MSRWTCWWSSAGLQALERAARAEGPWTEFRPDKELYATCQEELRRVSETLEQGPGFVVLKGLPLDRLSLREATTAYWLLGQMLGEPLAQNVQGTLLYDVRDTGQNVSQGARFSVTNYESSFHTDNSFGETVLDYVGLLCLHTARSGGISQMVHGETVYDCLNREASDDLATLREPFHVERRGGVRPGEAPTIFHPVIAEHQGRLLYRYLRTWIEAGHQTAGQPLTQTQRSALDRLDGVMARPDLRVEFSLEPGDIYFLNNRWLLHNRTAFEDHSEPERKRHLVRLWLQRRNP